MEGGDAPYVIHTLDDLVTLEKFSFKKNTFETLENNTTRRQLHIPTLEDVDEHTLSDHDRLRDSILT